MPEKIKNILGYIFEVAGYAFLVAVMVFMLGAYNQSRAANYTWLQTDWSTGATGNTATHTSNQTGWAQYSSGSNATVSTAGQVSLSPAVSTTQTSDADFSTGTHSATQTSGAGQVWLTSRTATNIALSHAVTTSAYSTASCSGVDATPSPARAADGNTATGWCAGAYSPQWALVDLGALTELSVFKMYWSNDDSAGVCVTWIPYYSSDASNWTSAAAYVAASPNGSPLTTPQYGNTIFTARGIQGRYIRASISSISSGGCGLNNKYTHMNELEVYGWVDGNYISNAIDTGAASNFTTISYNVTIPLAVPYTDATIDVRGSSDGASWTAWQTGVASGGSISALSGYRYIQYRVNLSRRGTYAGSPTLDDVTINYRNQNGYLISSSYDSTDSGNVPYKITWTESLPAGTDVKFQLRTSPDNATWTGWMGPDGTSGTYFTDPAGGETLPSALRTGNNDRYMQYEVFLSADANNNTPILYDVTMYYTVNAAPNFDATFGSSGASASQISDSADANWGKVKIMYSVRDTDTSTDTGSQYLLTPSFQYNIGGGWQTITSGYLSANALATKTVSASGYTTYTAYWDAKAQIPGNYSATAQVKVAVDDLQGANNTASVTVSSVTLDTTAPAVASATANSTTDTIALNVTDNTNIQYRFSNNSNMSADGSNGTSGAWQTVGAATYNNSFAWIFTGAPSYETVYYQVRDIYNNSTATSSIVIPLTPSQFELKDISNINTGVYKLFTNWAVYAATTSAAFANYKVYRSTNGTSYSLLTTLTDVNLNYYLDTTVASTTAYYYKVTTTDTGGDVSNYSAALSDIPNGQGGSDNTPPTISAVAVAETQATWVRITWTTDEVANSTVEYSTTAANNYALTSSNTAYVTSHDITLSGLTAGTAYVFRVKSIDVAGNLTTSTSASYTFTTASGPSISAVASQSVGESGATIVWNTTANSDSYVLYATSIATLSGGGTSAGSASLVGGSAPYAHSVALTGLTPNTTYYYYVKSTDTTSNLMTNTNGGSYYNFTTTHDVAAPVISNIAVPVKTASALVVTWQTDELSDSQVVYGTASGSYPSQTTLDPTLSINHVASLSGLTENTPYYFKVKSKDVWNNLATSAEQTSTTTATTTVTITNTVTNTVYVGSGGSAMTDTTPPEISDIKVSDIGPFEATVSFRTNEDTSGFALYGTTPDLGKSAGDEKFRLEHKIRISGLKLGTDYHLRVAAADKGGNVRTSDEQTFTTQFAAESVAELQKLENVEGFQEQLETLIESYLPSLAPPFISRVDVTDVTENSAKVSFKTNTPAYGILQYASERDYNEKADNPYATALAQTEKKTREHIFDLTGLASGTEYHIQAQAYVLPGVIGKSKDTIFYTKSAKISPEIVRVGNTLVELSWRTDVLTSSFAEYRDVKTKAVGQVGNPTPVKAHNLLIGNLVPNSSYDIRVFGEDERGQRVDGTPIRVKTKQDTTPPEVSAISINNALLPGRADKLQTVIAWKTNEPANSLVYFDEGLGSDEPKNLVGQYNEYVAEHVVIVTAMKPATVYRIKIVSFDESGNKSESPVKTILTPRSAESVLDIIIRNFEESFGFLRGVQ